MLWSTFSSKKQIYTKAAGWQIVVSAVPCKSMANGSDVFRLPNLVVITLLENYDYFVHTLDTIGNQWEIFVYRFDLSVTSLYNNDICEKFMISMNFGDWIHLITHCSMI